MAAATASSAAKLCPLTRASVCGSAAAIPPATGAKPGAAARGLTHTMRWASRARRSISRPTTAGSPTSQPSLRITTTAPRASPRRPWRRLNTASASPIRVPLDQSGAAGPAPSQAGPRAPPPRRRGQPGQPRGEDEGLGPRAASRRALQELEVGARVGLHRARDVAQQHEPPRLLAPPAPRPADRVAAGAQAAADGGPQVDALAAPPYARTPRAARRGGEGQPRHQP